MYAFNNDDCEENDIDVHTAIKTLEIDWQRDSQGDGVVDGEEFMDAIFELAVTWFVPMQSLLGQEDLQPLTRNVFRIFNRAKDENHDGILNHEDVVRYLQTLFSLAFAIAEERLDEEVRIMYASGQVVSVKILLLFPARTRRT